MRHLGLLLLVLAPFAGAQSFSVTPKEVALGTTYTLVVQQKDCKEPGGALLTTKLSTSTTGLSIPLADAKTNLTCQAAWKLEVGSSAPLGKTNFELRDATGNLVGLLDLEVIAIAPGPTPPGLAHQVDVMWKILPYRAVSDSFGRRVASQYYAVQIMIGNNTGFPLQITSIGFLPKGLKDAKLPPLPNDPYNMGRSTIEREQQVGRRAVVLHSLEAAAGVLTGISGFVRNAGHRGNYNLFVGLTNPISSGYDIVWPDKTVRHLIAMDTRAFRDAALIPNNVPSPPIVTFFSRELVECDPCPSSAAATRGITRVPYKKKDFNPNEIMDRLGELVIEGLPIEYKPRLSVAGNRVTPTAAPPVANALGTNGILKQGEKVTIPITGSGLDQGTVVADPASGITISPSPAFDRAHGRSVDIEVTVSDDAAPGPYNLTLSNSAGTTKIPVTIAPAKPQVTSVTPSSGPQGQSHNLVITGRFLKGATLTLKSAPENTSLPVTSTTPGRIDATLTPPATAPAQKMEFVVERAGVASDPVRFETTAVKPEVTPPSPALKVKKGEAATFTIKGRFLNGATITADESTIRVSDLQWTAPGAASQPESLAFKVATTSLTPVKTVKLKIANGTQVTEIDLVVEN